MSEYVFRRPPTWSTAYTAARIEAALRRCRDDVDQIDREKRELDVKAAELCAYSARLEELLQVELAKRDRRARKRARSADGGSSSHPASPDRSPPVSVDFASAVVHTGKRAHDAEGLFFTAEGQRRTGSTEPKRYPIDAEGDPRIRRLVKMIEVPGLIHAMVMAEKAQEVIDVEAVEVPAGALGINLSDAYCDHVFSVEAFNALIDPGKADDYLAQLQAGIIPDRGR